MTRLILAGASGIPFTSSDFADQAILFSFRFVWGPLPSPDDLVAYLAARTNQHAPGNHWSDFSDRGHHADNAGKGLALVELCQQYDTVELWFDPAPNDQLQLAWLLSHFRSYPEVVARLRLRLVDFDLIKLHHEQLGKLKVPDVDVTTDELEAASVTWQAYRETTPEAFFDLCDMDLSVLPLLKPALLDLLEELPSNTTGLGATEMRLLELIRRGYALTNALFHLQGLRQRRVFNSWEIGLLLEGLAHGPRPAIAGLDDALRTLDRDNYRDRDAAFKRSRLSLTEFGKAIVARNEDFSRHNPIDRWWGGTRLSNDRLWRWKTTLMKPER